MALQAPVSSSLTDLFVEQIQGTILSGELKVGEKLPTAFARIPIDFCFLPGYNILKKGHGFRIGGRVASF